MAAGRMNSEPPGKEAVIGSGDTDRSGAVYTRISTAIRRRDHEPLLRRRATSALKLCARSLVPAPAGQRRVLLVFGCQRSGTTMLQQSLLDRSWRALILEEHSRRLVRSDDAERLRWQSLDIVAARLRALPFELVVAKPLVESHRAVELLDGCGQCRGIWMLRHYLAVARSNLQRFGPDNGLRDLRLLAAGSPGDWRSAAGGDVRERVAGLLASGLSQLDAAAAFWWARNRLYLDQQLWADERIRLVRYETLTRRPGECLEALSGFLGQQLPVSAMAGRARPATAERGVLRPDVEAMCADLLERLTACPSVLPEPVSQR